MFSSRPSSSRKSSMSKRHEDVRDKGSDTKERRRTNRVNSRDLQTTFENMIHTISVQQGNALDKESVVKMLKSMYDWIVFDPNLQLDVPVAPGSSSAPKMWPHGAVVDSRRKPAGDHEEKSSRKLKELDDEVASVVTSSVVSSTYDEQRSVKSRGEVMYDMPRGNMYSPNEHYPVHGDDSSQYMPGPPPAFTQRTTRIVPDGFQPRPRYSILKSGVGPVGTVVETPEPVPAQTFRTKKGKKPKIGTANRNDDDGVPQRFADE